MRLGVALLASGQSTRFGRNKLLEPLCGRPVMTYGLSVLSTLSAQRRIVVAAEPAVAEIARANGFEIVVNGAPEAGQGHSVALAVGALSGMDAALLLAGDMPLVSAASLKRLVDAFERGHVRAACLRDGTHSGNPAIFSSTLFPELRALSGDRGAKRILLAQGEGLAVVDCLRGEELLDVDTPQALERAEALIRAGKRTEFP